MTPPSQIGAIIVTYWPDPAVRRNLAALRGQVGHIVIVDNTATQASRELLDDVANWPEVEVVVNSENLGIAAALNQGVARLLERGVAWVATFDQDSHVSPDFVARLLAAHAGWPDRDRVAIVAPLHRDQALGGVTSASGPFPAPARVDAVVRATATSGNLVAAAALRAIGGFRADFFIDCVDFEFCLRCRRAGWLVLEARGVIMDHAQGRWERRRFFGRERRLNDYAAVRRYYQTRNRVALYTTLGAVDPCWTLQDLHGFAWDGLKLLLLGRDRGAKLRAMLAGIRDGMAGRMGPRPE